MGPPKSGKSFLGLDIGLHVAQGKPFLGHPSVSGPVWYLQLDTGEGIWRERLKDLRDAGYDLGGPLKMVHPDDVPRHFNILATNCQVFVRDALKDLDPALIIVDVLREFHAADENDSTEMKRVGDLINELFYSRAVILIHHTKKIPEGVEHPNIINLSRGSSAITGKADALWLLFNNKLKITSRFDEDITYKADRLETGMWHFPDIKHRTEAAERVLSLCAEYPDEPHSSLAKVAGERWGMSRASYYRYLAGLECAHRPSVPKQEETPLAEDKTVPNQPPDQEH